MLKQEARKILKIARKEGIPVIVITRHAGDAAYNGGEYGFWFVLYPEKRGKWIREFGTTAEFEFCKKYGYFGKCEHEEDYQILSTKEVIESLRKAEFIEIGIDGIYLDATGHEPQMYGDEIRTGCKICYP